MPCPLKGTLNLSSHPLPLLLYLWLSSCPRTTLTHLSYVVVSLWFCVASACCFPPTYSLFPFVLEPSVVFLTLLSAGASAGDLRDEAEDACEEL